ncbi:MAG: hypothetical protein ACRDXD_05560 [Acidimicrobiia bacterium]
MHWFVRLLVIFLLLAQASSAWAKFPLFTVELEPQRPVAGRSVKVMVHTQQDVPLQEVGGLLAAWPAAEWKGEEPRGPSLPISLERSAPATFEGRVTFPEPGTWVVVPFPQYQPQYQMRGPCPECYPDILTVHVSSLWDASHLRLRGALAVV